MTPCPLPSISLLRQRLVLKDGCLYWLPIPVTRPHDITWNKKNAGRRVGCPKGNGYEMFHFNRRALLVNRVVFALSNGADPGRMLVDHANGKRADNNPINLRLATNAENVQHRSAPGKNNTSGVVGVCWHKGASKWCASIRVNGRNIHLGLFTDLAAAAGVRREAEKTHFRLKETR